MVVLSTWLSPGVSDLIARKRVVALSLCSYSRFQVSKRRSLKEGLLNPESALAWSFKNHCMKSQEVAPSVTQVRARRKQRPCCLSQYGSLHEKVVPCRDAGRGSRHCRQ